MYRKQQYKTEVTCQGYILPLPIISEYPLIFDLLDKQDSPDFIPELLATFYTYFLPKDLEDEFDECPYLLTEIATEWMGEVIHVLNNYPRLEGVEERLNKKREAKTTDSVGKVKSMVDAVAEQAKQHIGKNRFNISAWVSWLADKSDHTSSSLYTMSWQQFIEISNIYQAYADIEYTTEQQQKKKEELAKNKANRGKG